MSTSLFSAQLHPGRALGFLVLGASLHDILTRLKAEPQRFPKLDLTYSPTDPVREPVTLTLPANGIRLRFDGPEQRLRLVEVLDFAKNHIFFREQNTERDLVRPAAVSTTTTTTTGQPGEAAAGPTFRHIYQRFLGPTYDGEFIAGAEGETGRGTGIYVLSYPGVAFTFPMARSAYSPDKDVVSLLSPSSSATSMAVFSGESWAQARQGLWTEELFSVKALSPLPRGKDASPDEVSLVRIHGGGRLQLLRKWTSASTWVVLGETTPQQLVAELGPPDAIYRKSDQRMYVHKIRTASSSRTRPSNGAAGDLGRRQPDELVDTDQSSAHTGSDDSHDEAVEDGFQDNVSSECFYNYFYLGFDVLVSTPAAAAAAGPPPSQQNGDAPPPLPETPIRNESADRLVATKVVLHANVPGSYPFNRHRRCRWEIAYLDGPETTTCSSETPFTEMEERLRAAWRPIYASEAEARARQRGMVLNRGWGDSPGSSCELLGDWEESGGGTVPRVGRRSDGSEDSTTTLYGFPGLVFEVLRNGFVSAVTVF